MITLNGISKQFGAKVIYNRITTAFNPGFRYGLIGPNGTGKTILMRIMSGLEEVDEGSVNIPASMSLGYLPQEVSFSCDTTPLGIVLAPFSHLLESEAHLHALAEAAYDSADFKRAAAALDRLHAEQSIHDVYALPSKAKAILSGLGIPAETWESDVRHLSGGFQMRVLLAQILLKNPTFLLLDEPTNHLDMDSLIWLEKFLTRFSGGMLVVSHDRDFLNRIITHTAELLAGSLNVYAGTIEQYFAWRTTFRETEEKRLKNIQDKINQTTTFIERFGAKNTKATQARSKEKMLDRLKAQLPASEATVQSVHFHIPQAVQSGSIPLSLKDVSVGYGDKPVFSRLSMIINRSDKIAFLGPNGAGKSTLLKTMASFLVPDAGEMRIGHNALVRYYSQHRLDQLQPELTVLQTIAATSKTTEKAAVRALLGSFLFSGDDVDKKVGVLSGGEKSRLSLATILSDPGNVLLLDEPTNHLDLQTIEYLAKALHDFDGTVLIVSHDQYFISLIANRIIEVRPGSVRDFPGTLPDYRTYIEAGYAENSNNENEKGKREQVNVDSEKQERIRRREELKKISRRIEKLEREIADVETQIKAAQAVLNDPANTADYLLLQESAATIKKLTGACETLLFEWETLHDEQEMPGQ